MAAAEILRVLDDGNTRWDRAPKPQAVPLHPEPALVEPGEYQAVYIGHRGLSMYRGRKLVVWWRILEHAEILLPRYYRVLTYQPRISAPASSDIMREVAAALGRRIRRDQIPVASLAEAPPVRVDVRTVVRDRSQRDLPEVCTYSVISRVIGP